MPFLKRSPKTQDLTTMAHQQQQRRPNTSDPSTSDFYEDALEYPGSFILLEPGDLSADVDVDAEEQPPSREEQIREIEEFLRALGELDGLAFNVVERRAEQKERRGNERLFLMRPLLGDEEGGDGEEGGREKSGFASVGDDMLREDHEGLEEIEIRRDEGENLKERERGRWFIGIEGSSSYTPQAVSGFSSPSWRERRSGISLVWRDGVEGLGLEEEEEEEELVNVWAEPVAAKLEDLDEDEGGQKEEDAEEERPWDEVRREILLAAAANVVLLAAVWGLTVSYGVAEL